MTVATDTSYNWTMGDYRVYKREGQRDDGAKWNDAYSQILLYNWRTGKLALQIDGRVIATWNDTTLVIAAEKTTHVIDLQNQKNYVLQNSDVEALYSGKALDYSGSRIQVFDPKTYIPRTAKAEAIFMPDVEAILKIP